MSRTLSPENLTEEERTREIAAIFGKGILRLKKSRNRLEFSHKTGLTGVGPTSGPKETDRQGALTPCRSSPPQTLE